MAENVKGASVGDPVAGIDSDPLIHTLSGDDADAFSIDNSGQIKTAKKLDYETKSMYTVTVTATDPSLSSVSIVVNITVTDVDDPATVTLTGDGSISYAENGTEPVATFSATDQDGDAIAFSLGGADVKLFEISASGALSFKESPNYESPADADEDNVYMVTVNAARGSTDVAVTVTNVDEPGSVTVLDLRPQAGAGQSATASIWDPDGGAVSTAWQWSRSMDKSEWMDIAGATAVTYTPQEEDVGYYLRATATYSDGLGSGRDSASGISDFPVELRPTANFAPTFEGQDTTGPDVDDQDETGDPAGIQDDIVVTRSVNETADVGASVGNAVTATDADNDPLIYRMTGVNTGLHTDDDGTADETVNSATLFKIDRKTGQISVKDKSKLDFEAYATTLDDAGTTDVDERALVYTVNVTATDPSGAVTDPSPQLVTINVTPVDEPPVITRTSANLGADVSIIAAGDSLLLVNTKEENPLSPIAGGGAGDAGAGLPVFQAVDPEMPTSTDIEWSLAGPDAGRFNIVKLATDATSDPLVATNTAALRWDGTPPSFEAMDSSDGTNVYVVDVRASDGEVRDSVTVRVTVDNIEEGGEVSLSQRVPQEGIAITARLDDEDGNISGTKWQWYRVTPSTTPGTSDPALVDSAGDRNPDGIDTTGDGTADVTSVTKCSADTPSVICAIDAGTSATYVPTRADAGNYLQAWATYVDEFVSDEFTVGDAPAFTRSTRRCSCKGRRGWRYCQPEVGTSVQAEAQCQHPPQVPGQGPGGERSGGEREGRERR